MENLLFLDVPILKHITVIAPSYDLDIADAKQVVHTRPWETKVKVLKLSSQDPVVQSIFSNKVVSQGYAVLKYSKINCGTIFCWKIVRHFCTAKLSHFLPYTIAAFLCTFEILTSH